jgi:GntR family transcriptional regulator
MPHQPLQTPLYQRVFGVLYQRIQHGEYPVGSALSAEARLAEEFGVSKATIRQAIGELVNRGIVVRRQGKGTFVCPDADVRPGPRFVGSMTDLITGIRDLPIRDRSVECNVTFPIDVWAQLAMSQPKGTVVRFVREVDGTSFAFVVQYIPSDVADHIKPGELKSAGPIDLLHRHGVHISAARQTISAELADVEVAKYLNIELGAAVLFAERLVRGDDGPVQLVRTWYRGDFYRWEAEVEYVWSPDGPRLSVKNDQG